MLRAFDIVDGALAERDDAAAGDLAGAIWIDVHEPDAAETEQVEQVIGAPLPDPRGFGAIESSARGFTDEAGIHIRSLFLTEPGGRTGTTTVACLLQQRRLVTVRPGGLRDFRLLRCRSREGQVESHSPQDLLLDLFEQKIDHLADRIEQAHADFEQLGTRVLDFERADLFATVGSLARLEDDIGKARLCLMDTQRSVLFLQRCLNGDDQEFTDVSEEIIRDIDSLMSHATFLFERANFLMASTQGFINIEQSKIIKIFSVAAVVFLPPTMVASVYGMNFEHLPELGWVFGYPWSLFLMILSGVAPYWYFKRKGWL